MTETIGKQIKRIREEQKQSQKSLAEELGINAAILSQLETGKQVDTNVEKIEFVCDYLGIPHTNKQLQAAKYGKELETPMEKVETVGPKEITVEEGKEDDSLLKMLEGKRQHSIELSDRHMIAAEVYQEVIDLIEGEVE